LDKETGKGESEFELIERYGEKLEKSQTYPLYDGEYKSTKTSIGTLEKAQEITTDMKKKEYIVAEVQQRETKRSPLPPFTTSTLQQEASRRFGYAGKRTMSLAQKLYEEGFITYHRTDSVMLGTAAIEAVRAYVVSQFGERYIPEKNRFYAMKQKGAQEAHEAIRPTKFQMTGEQVTAHMGADYGKLYELIWRRAVSSQMSDAIIESTGVIVDSTDKVYRLKTNGSVLIFDGFLKINPQALQDNRLPQFIQGEMLKAKSIRDEEHITTPPPRYNDASLIATLEDKGIGRPSTYASIIGTIADRAYIERIEKRFQPTAIGMAVNDFLVTNFQSIDDIPFTADMELQLDNVADGTTEWVTMMKGFYTPFEKKLVEVEGADRVKIAVEDTGEKCPLCNEGNLVVRSGRFGKFISCGRFPECKFTKPLVKDMEIACPKDGGKVIQRKTRKGRMFYGCSNYPNCDFAVWKLEDIASYDPNKVTTEVQGEKKTVTKKKPAAKKVVKKTAVKKKVVK
jgi:DNA topoisomerase-1